MAFQTKSFFGIVAGMLNQVRATTDKLTDFTVGSVTRTLIEAAAVEIEELYQNMLLGLIEAIPTAIYQVFGFGIGAPVAATGIVTFSLAAAQAGDAFFPAGTRVGTDDGTRVYATISDTTIIAGQTSISVGVRALTAGRAGNAAAYAINRLLTSGAQAASVTNQAPITNGADGETEEQRRLRFLDFIAAISRGPLYSIEYGARQARITDADGNVLERVVSARAVELFRISDANPLGYVDVYIYNGADGASPELLEEVIRQLEGQRAADGSATIGFKAAGVICRAYAVTPLEVDAAYTLRTVDGRISDTQLLALQSAAATVIQQTQPGSTLYRSALIAAAKDVEGITDAVLDSPGVDLMVASTAKPVTGTLTFALAA